MSINLTPDPDADTSCLERCCFCRAPTKFWCAEKDVAVCPKCAETHTPEQVPTKKEWFDKEEQHRKTAFPHLSW